jgi:long-chain acyl-CoA synthetase
MLVQNILQLKAARLPDKVAVVCNDRRLSYADLDGMANRLALALRLEGVKKGDVVGIYLENSVEAVASIFGILKAGAAFVMINRTSKRHSLTSILNHAKATALILDSQAAGNSISHLQTEVPSLGCTVITGENAPEVITGLSECISFNAVQKEFSPKCLPSLNEEHDMASVTCFSKNTGELRAVKNSHTNVLLMAARRLEYFQNRSMETVVAVAPLWSDDGFYQLLNVYQCGGTLILKDTFTNPSPKWSALEEDSFAQRFIPASTGKLQEVELVACAALPEN